MVLRSKSLVVMAVAVLTGVSACASLQEEDRALIESARAAAQSAEQSAEAAAAAARSAEQAAKEAKAASDRSEAIYNQLLRKT